MNIYNKIKATSPIRLLGYVTGIGWISYLGFLAVIHIGTTKTIEQGLWNWEDVAQIVIILTIPFLGGLMAGKE